MELRLPMVGTVPHFERGTSEPVTAESPNVAHVRSSLDPRDRRPS